MVCMHFFSCVRPCLRFSSRKTADTIPGKLLEMVPKWSIFSCTPPSSKYPSFLELRPLYFYRFCDLKKAFQQGTSIVLAAARNFINCSYSTAHSAHYLFKMCCMLGTFAGASLEFNITFDSEPFFEKSIT